MGLTFLRYTRPVDQFDRISMIRQDRYRYVWVRDKDGKEFAFFIPMDKDVEQRSCKFVDESKYDMPTVVPHTSGTSSMVSDSEKTEYRNSEKSDSPYSGLKQ